MDFGPANQNASQWQWTYRNFNLYYISCETMTKTEHFKEELLIKNNSLRKKK